MINKHLFVLLACVFVVMIGLGITMPVLPFYVERLALAEGATRQAVVMHVGLLTGVYALGLIPVSVLECWKLLRRITGWSTSGAGGE